MLAPPLAVAAPNLSADANRAITMRWECADSCRCMRIWHRLCQDQRSILGTKPLQGPGCLGT